MCGRYSIEFDEGFYTRFKLSNKIRFKSNYNAAPSQILPVIVAQSPNSMESMKWGLIPGLINIREDTITTKGWAQKYIQFQRCLVPASGSYEWKQDSLGKHPYYFYLKNTKYFSFAGVYSNTTKSYAIITTTANNIIRPIHDRLPVILKEEEEDVWLNHDKTEIEQLHTFLHPYRNAGMEKYPVSEEINSITYNQKPKISSVVVQDSLL